MNEERRRKKEGERKNIMPLHFGATQEGMYVSRGDGAGNGASLGVGNSWWWVLRGGLCVRGGGLGIKRWYIIFGAQAQRGTVLFVLAIIEFSLYVCVFVCLRRCVGECVTGEKRIMKGESNRASSHEDQQTKQTRGHNSTITI